MAGDKVARHDTYLCIVTTRLVLVSVIRMIVMQLRAFDHI
jgi:hypothetical protein